MSKQSTYIKLSERELEVLKLLWAGLSKEEIGDKLGCKAATVSMHRKNIGNKLMVSTTWQLARRALELGLIGVKKGGS